MVWGAANSGYYADLPGGQVQCQPRFIANPHVITAEVEDMAWHVRIGNSQILTVSRLLGAPKGSKSVQFTGSFARNFGGAEVVAGFIQILTPGTRDAYYIAGQNRRRVWRDPALIGSGLLDCGTEKPPWLTGSTAQIPPLAVPGQMAKPVLVSSSDNPHWAVPVSVPSEDGKTQIPLSNAEIRNNFLTFAVARAGQQYYPICSIRWEINISWSQPDDLQASVRATTPWGTVSAQDRTLLMRCLSTMGITANNQLFNLYGPA